MLNKPPAINILDEPKRVRVLLITPPVSKSEVGGLQLALGDVAEQLVSRNWEVDTIPAEPSGATGEIGNPAYTRRAAAIYSGFGLLHRWPLFVWAGKFFPLPIRALLSRLFMPIHFYKFASGNLHEMEALLKNATRYDLILLCADGSAPGLTALISDLNDRVVLISLLGLSEELGTNGWGGLRKLACLFLREKVHPYLYRPVTAGQIKLAIFASTAWRNDAIRAGLPEKIAHTIYFGVPLPEPLPRSSDTHHRLLWVGRLSAEKGLHLLLPALAIIRNQLKEITLTIIAAQGGQEYQMRIRNLIVQYGLEDVITWRPAVERAALQEAYATHDALFFHSVFADPVALVLMEAFAAGLPVVSSQAPADASLVREELTCLCYRPADAGSVAAAIIKILTDLPLRERLARNAQQLVQQKFSLNKMGEAYDKVLRQFVGEDSIQVH